MDTSLSDLELVAQAMDVSQPTPSLKSMSNPSATNDNDNSMTDKVISQTTPVAKTSNPLDGIDLSTLSAEDRTSLQPIIDALANSSLTALSYTGNGADGEEYNEEDDVRIQELLAQMDAAGEVADEIEGKLDRLLAQLGGLGQEIEGGFGAEGSEAEAKVEEPEK